MMSLSSVSFSQNIQNPSLSSKNSSTLIIDSIPIVNTQVHQLTGLNKKSYDYRLFFGSFRTNDYPSFGISRTRPHLIVQNSAFTHQSLFNPATNINIQNGTWDNPTGAESLGQGIIAASLQLLTGIRSISVTKRIR